MPKGIHSFRFSGLVVGGWNIGGKGGMEVCFRGARGVFVLYTMCYVSICLRYQEQMLRKDQKFNLFFSHFLCRSLSIWRGEG